jgi:FSR family fosmidomycin resistance protein-like MFS transporter
MFMSDTIAVPDRTTEAAGRILGAVSFGHLLNDMLQSLLPAIYPILKGGFHLNFGQIGLLTLTYQITASLLQPIVGLATDRRPQPFSLPVGMGFTLAGMVMLAVAPSYGLLLAGAALLGIGSSIFHPEASRIARLVSGGKHGLAQSVFQVGGNFGGALGPLIAAFLAALAGILVLTAVGRWYRRNGHAQRKAKTRIVAHATLSAGRVKSAVAILLALVFSKYFYLASLTSYYIFYLMHRFHLGVQAAQIDLFVFLGASAVGTFAGGPIGDRFGRKNVLWVSIVGVIPFTLALPYCGLAATIVLSVVIGLVISSAFSAIVVFAQELLPGRVGMVSGMFFGFAFGMGGIGAAVLGELADWTSIEYVYHVVAFVPLIGLLTAFLPNLERRGAV